MRLQAILLILAMLAACTQTEEEAPAPTVAAIRGPLVYEASYHGELKAKNSEAIHAPELTGVRFLTVDTVVDDGTMVKEGDPVLTFVEGPLQDELRASETELAVAKAEYQRTVHNLEQERVELELDVKRKKMAVAKSRLYVVEGVNLISELELSKYRIDVSKAQIEHDLARKELRAFTQKRATALEIKNLRVDAAQRKVDEKQSNLEHMVIKAPAEGMLYGPYTRLNWVRGKVAPGSVCRPGDKMLEIPDLTSYLVEIYVRQRDAALINIGAQAIAYPTASPDTKIRGRVTQKDDVATTRNERLGTELPENNLKELKVVLELDEAPDFLRPSGTARVDLRIELVPDTLLIPLAAITDDGGTPTITRPNGDKIPIEVGKTSTVYGEVLSGLVEGDLVLLE